MVKKHLPLALSVFGLIFFCSCSVINQGMAILRTPRNFIAIGNRVYVENNSDEQFGRDLQNVLPRLIDSVEKKELHKFIELPDIYVCSTNKSFCKYAGSKYPGPRARVTPKGLFISPRLKGSKNWNEIVYHELSHVVLLQYTGTYRYINIPVWFHEGLATYISNGGGSGDITDSAATLEILKGNHFYPAANENILFPKSFTNDKIPPWMHYRQSMLFVEFIKEGKEKEFENLLNAIFRKNSFSKSIEVSYGVTLSVLWNGFLEKLRSQEIQSGAAAM